MKEYTIYFELFGKKMKTTVHALSEERAKDRMKDKIIFHKVEEIKKKSKSDFIDDLKKMAEDMSKGFPGGNPFGSRPPLAGNGNNKRLAGQQ